MLLIMGVTLYTSRVILKALGFEDFGVYNVVGGVVASFGFFSSSLSNATQRFLNYELGRGEIDKVKDVFNLSLLIYVIIAFIIFVVAELIGTWFITSKLVIPQTRINAAIWVFNATLLSLVVTLIGIVFDSVLISRENMKVYAYSGVIDAVGKLVVALMINEVTCDKLKLYACLLLCVTLFSKILPVITCLKLYPECKVQLYWDKQLFVNMFRFIGWNGVGTAVWAVNEHGMVILLNLFFGPIVNAARAIASQVNTAVNNFSNNFLLAVSPQLVKSYAKQDINYYIKLLYSSSKYSFFLMWLLCLPIILCCDDILSLWLHDVPEYTKEFVIWILIYSMVNVLTIPIWNAIQAVGKLKKYILIGSSVYLMAFPISYIFLMHGFSPLVTFQVLTVIRMVYLFVVLMILKNYVSFKISQYCNKVLVPIILVLVSTSLIMNYINSIIPKDGFHSVMVCLMSIIISLSVIFVLGLSSQERNFLLTKIVKK